MKTLFLCGVNIYFTWIDLTSYVFLINKTRQMALNVTAIYTTKDQVNSSLSGTNNLSVSLCDPEMFYINLV